MWVDILLKLVNQTLLNVSVLDSMSAWDLATSGGGSGFYVWVSCSKPLAFY